mmetsp:Transcript_30268/g.46327  ORF Transcript_30268/g.46327 Transcript_30268/m.46327 type:complete len:690 (+) Transcript_30268:100-2169(+)
MKYLAAINLLTIAKIESFAPLPGYLVPTSIGHHIHEGQRLGRSSQSQVSLIPLQVAKVPSTSSANEDDTMDDETLLKEITESQLQELCEQSNVSTAGSKEEMLSRLRLFAQEQATKDKTRREYQKQRIENGVDEQGNGKAKHKISTEEELDDDEDLDGVFYFSIPGEVPTSQNKTLAKISTTTIKKTTNPQNAAQEMITAPPPPPNVKPNEDGERVVTVYSSTDQNDLTGIAAQQASASGNEQAMAGGYSRADNMGASADNPQNTLAAGPFGDQSGSQRKKADEKDFDAACEVITELVYSLLSMTGAPGFQEEFSEGLTPFMTEEEKGYKSSEDKAGNKSSAPSDFVGFDPSRVPTQMITRSTRALRVGNGEAMRKVLNDAEMQGIGFDGINGDDKDKGGGHFLEVAKVGTFLEGFRKAEVRRIARETTTMLLDQLVTGGVKGLDSMLMTMTKGGDDSSDSGELNDSLVKYLEEAVREQENKVEQMFGSQGVLTRDRQTQDKKDDKISAMWNVTTDEDGNLIESLDPNDPAVKKALEQELKAEAVRRKSETPLEPAKQLLTLLTLLRERVKAEAAFTNDEKGRNLRMLAYCIHAQDNREREKLIVDNMGKMLDKLDSFSELLTSSIEYAESTTHQLQPSKSGPLNLMLLRSIKDIVEDVKEKQAWKASGVSSVEQNRPLPRNTPIDSKL